eukprot:scaffold2714_cov413-Prasinococcus_capsulatus_cf.AAC.2
MCVGVAGGVERRPVTTTIARDATPRPAREVAWALRPGCVRSEGDPRQIGKHVTCRRGSEYGLNVPLFT